MLFLYTVAISIINSTIKTSCPHLSLYWPILRLQQMSIPLENPAGLGNCKYRGPRPVEVSNVQPYTNPTGHKGLLWLLGPLFLASSTKRMENYGITESEKLSPIARDYQNLDNFWPLWPLFWQTPPARHLLHLEVRWRKARKRAIWAGERARPAGNC